MARAACVELCGQGDGIDDDDIQLLGDIEDTFVALQKKCAPHMELEFVPSIQLVRELKGCDESPWQDTELTPHKLAKMLRPFGVRPRQSADKTCRGYRRGDFDDSFRRYIRPDRHSRPEDDSDQQEQGENK